MPTVENALPLELARLAIILGGTLFSLVLLLNALGDWFLLTRDDRKIYRRIACHAVLSEALRLLALLGFAAWWLSALWRSPTGISRPSDLASWIGAVMSFVVPLLLCAKSIEAWRFRRAIRRERKRRDA
jgi:hypothetical protein